jgi:hypothetical protein
VANASVAPTAATSIHVAVATSTALSMEGEFLRGTVQHDEVSDFPRKGRLFASLGLSLVSFLTLARGRSSVRLPPVPGDDNGKLRCLSRELVETPQSSMADDDTNRLLR